MPYAIEKADRIHQKTALLSRLARRFYDDVDSIPDELIDALDEALRNIEIRLDTALEYSIVNTANKHPQYATSLRPLLDALCDTLYVESPKPSTTP
jgi:hypothetical protein